ncbi:Holliday junction branch migration protein RuvA [Mycoplasmopsis hyopharyngis]|uniref:Holliday junction branch migration protein RuvA n=1 Tax=Mycoplasmopsis hyopharyngis TaxID=29558 RepID=UPI003872D1F5
MILYRIGELLYKNNNNVVFESQGIGYSITVPDIKRFENNTKMKMYIFEIENDFYKGTYGFKDFKERLLFKDLISINGIGPRVAFNILNYGWEKSANLIALNNIEELTKIPYLNPKIARNIVIELQDKWSKLLNLSDTEVKNNINNPNFNEIRETLKMLGFKSKQIEYALQKVEVSSDVEKMIESAIKIIAENKNESTIA